MYRYVDIIRNDDDIAKEIQINEVFLGFEVTVGSSAAELESKMMLDFTSIYACPPGCRRVSTGDLAQ